LSCMAKSLASGTTLEQSRTSHLRSSVPSRRFGQVHQNGMKDPEM
jgi:hypothetical protein